MKPDWYDLLRHERYPYPYRVQWNMSDGNVRVLPEGSESWKYAQVSVPAKYAETIGMSLLEEEIPCKDIVRTATR